MESQQFVRYLQKETFEALKPIKNATTELKDLPDQFLKEPDTDKIIKIVEEALSQLKSKEGKNFKAEADFEDALAMLNMFSHHLVKALTHFKAAKKFYKPGLEAQDKQKIKKYYEAKLRMNEIHFERDDYDKMKKSLQRISKFTDTNEEFDLKIWELLAVAYVFKASSKQGARYLVTLKEKIEDLPEKSKEIEAKEYQVNAQLKRYDSMFEQSLELYNKAMEIYKATKNVEGIFEVSCGIGDCLCYLNRPETALENFNFARELGRKWNPLWKRFANLCKTMAGMHFQYGNYKISIELLKEANVALESADLKVKTSLADNLSELGTHLFKFTDYKGAAEVLEKSLELFKAAVGPQHELSVRVMSQLANCYWGQNNLDKALEYYRFHYKFTQELYGFECIELAPIKISIGNVYYKKGDYKTALNHYTEGQKMFEELYNDPANMPIVYTNVGNCLYELGKYDEAYKFYKKGHEICVKVGLGKNPNAATALAKMGQIHQVKQEFEKANKCYEEAMAIQESKYGKESHQYANILSNYGVLKTLMGDPKGGAETVASALAYLRKKEQSFQNNAGTILKDLAKCYIHAKDFEKAEEAIKEGLEIELVNKVKMHPKLGSCYITYGDVHLEKGRVKEANECYEKALKIYGEMMPSDHPEFNYLKNKANKAKSQM